MPRGFVTGATGFIGGALVRSLLQEGWEVHCLAGRREPTQGFEDIQSRVTLHAHDGTTGHMVQILREARPEVVFHLASLFLSDHRPEDVEALIGSNLLFATQLAEAMAVSGVTRLVNTGTSWQHYHDEGYRPVNLYAATKQAFEDILAFYHDARGLSCLTLKLFDTYGPGDRRRKLVNILLEAARTGEPLVLSPGEQLIDLAHVDDVTAAFRQAARLLLEASEPRFDRYLVPGTRLSVRDLVDRMVRATGHPIRAHWGGRPYRPREVMVPVAAGDRVLPGWTPIVELDQALKQASLLWETP